MTYLLNVVYLLLLIAASPWLLFQAIRRGKYREGFAAKFFGRSARTAFQPAVHLVSRGQRGRSQSARRAAQGSCAAPAASGMRYFHDHDDRLCAGEAKIFTLHGVLLSVGFLVGRAARDAAHSPVGFGAGRIGIVAEFDQGGQRVRCAGGHCERSLKRAQFSRLSANSTAVAIDA